MKEYSRQVKSGDEYERQCKAREGQAREEQKSVDKGRQRRVCPVMCRQGRDRKGLRRKGKAK